MRILYINEKNEFNIPSEALEKYDFDLENVSNLDAIERLLEKVDPTIIIISQDIPADPYALGRLLNNDYTYVSTILEIDESHIDFKMALQSGFSDVIAPSAILEEKIISLIKAKEAIITQQEKLEKELELSKVKEKEIVVVSVASTKGGDGKTTMCVNLAIEFSKRNKKVCIIDLDLQFGDVPLLLDLTPKTSIYDWVKEIFGTNRIETLRYMTTYNEKIDVLAAPLLPEHADEIKGIHIEALVKLLKKQYDVIIFDTPPALVDTNLSAYDMSTHVTFVSTPVITSIKNVKLGIIALENLGLKDKIYIIFNKVSEVKNISLTDIERLLSYKIIGRVPTDYSNCIDAINQGKPYVSLFPSKPFSTSIENIVSFYLNEEPKKNKGFFGKK